jgi:hypothetical protein
MKEQYMPGNKTDEEKLAIYREVLGKAWDFVDYHDWPIKLNAAFHLFLEEFGDQFLADLHYLEEEEKKPLEEIARLFHNPARIFRLIEYTIYSLRRKRSPIQYQRQVALKLIAMVKALKHGSEFNEDGTNLIYEPEKVKQIYRDFLEGRSCTRENSQIIHRFCGVIWAYTESIFFRAHDVTKEIHGPYSLNNQNLVVKEYMNLNPYDIWPGVTLLPCHTVKIFKNYNHKIKINIDILNHLSLEKGVLPVPNLDSYYIEIDGREAPPDQLRELMEIIGNTISEITARIEQMSWHDLVMKYAEIFWYRKKPLRDARGLPWKPPEHLRETIYAGKPNPMRQTKLSKEQVQRLAQLTI